MIKTNYDIVMQNIIDNLEGTKKLLLHSCCAPCSTACISKLSDYFDITVFYYNPNIDTEDEYIKRKEEEKRFVAEYKSKNKLDCIDIGYDHSTFLSIAKGKESLPEGGERCFACYRERMRTTALYAKEHGYDYFATTLTLSPLKNAQQLNEIGLELEKEIGIKYLPSDFKKRDGYLTSIRMSAEYNLYRQNYCGCEFSKTRTNEESK